MKKILLLLLVALLAVVGPVSAQTLVQQSPTTLTACVLNQNAKVASTITITPPAGQYVYICSLEVSNCTGTVGTPAAVTNVTTTGLGGQQYLMGSGNTAGQCNANYVLPFANVGGLKSAAPGANVTFVIPALAAQQTILVDVVYYFAP
jgi:hypothetical protein